MNTLIFLCGMGVGALLATIAITVLAAMIVRKKSKAQSNMDDYNERCLSQLVTRNVLAERHAAALEQIVKGLAGNVRISGSPEETL